jgi:hypothetical protein
MSRPISRARKENHSDSNVRHFGQSFDQQHKLRRTNAAAGLMPIGPISISFIILNTISNNTFPDYFTTVFSGYPPAG